MPQKNYQAILNAIANDPGMSQETKTHMTNYVYDEILNLYTVQILNTVGPIARENSAIALGVMAGVIDNLTAQFEEGSEEYEFCVKFGQLAKEKVNVKLTEPRM